MCEDSNFSNQIEDSDSKLGFSDFLKDATFEECWRCWNFSPISFDKQVKILNPKYCWLYPKRTAKILNEIVPNYDECKTLYTSCDHKLEACVHEQILKIEKAFKWYEKTFRKELQLQTELIEQIWDQSVRYCLLTDCRLRDLLNQIKAEIEELDRRCGFLDMKVESPFLLGDGGQNRSLAYIREMIWDLNNYFCTTFCQLKSWAQLIDPKDIGAIEDYKAILHSAFDFNGFMIIGVPKCSCRRSQFVDCLKQHKPC